MSWNSRVISENVLETDVSQFLKSSPISISLDWNISAFTTKLRGPWQFSKLIGIGVVDEFRIEGEGWRKQFKDWLDLKGDLVLGYFSYDLKNELENLNSDNQDRIGFPKLYFFVPRMVIVDDNGTLTSYSHRTEFDVESTLRERVVRSGHVLPILNKDEYIESVRAIKQNIQMGDLYEMNYCVEHRSEKVVIDPPRLFEELKEASPAPFSSFLKHGSKFLIGSSPERFMMKKEGRLYTQPMKGTNRRTSENDVQKRQLRNDPKEVSENVMISDLVRNDLSRSAKKGTVHVDELCGVYEFEHVNTMISTVSAELREDVHSADAILHAFPMGSMTGAPKIRAMELIDQYENFSRGLYSGAVGYFTPELDFDFNVVIRSILYNEQTQVVTFPTGSAITINSDPEKEFEECMLKAEAMRKVLINHAK